MQPLVHSCVYAGATPIYAYFTPDGSGQIVLKNLHCTGTESRLIDCRHDGLGNNHTCSHSDDAGIKCAGITINNSSYASCMTTVMLMLYKPGPQNFSAELNFIHDTSMLIRGIKADSA